MLSGMIRGGIRKRKCEAQAPARPGLQRKCAMASETVNFMNFTPPPAPRKCTGGAETVNFMNFAAPPARRKCTGSAEDRELRELRLRRAAASPAPPRRAPAARGVAIRARLPIWKLSPAPFPQAPCDRETFRAPACTDG